jgi:hypothetical protein
VAERYIETELRHWRSRGLEIAPAAAFAWVSHGRTRASADPPKELQEAENQEFGPCSGEARLRPVQRLNLILLIAALPPPSLTQMMWCSPSVRMLRHAGFPHL